MRVLSWRGLVIPKFSAPPSGETVHQTPKNVHESSCHLAKFGGARISAAAGAAKNVAFFCLSVCLSVTLWNVGDCAPNFAMKALEYRNYFDTVGYGKFCRCAPVLSFLRLLPIGDTTKCGSPKYGKNWGFSPPEGGRINQSRQNLACKRIPWVCYSTPNLAIISKRGSLQ